MLGAGERADGFAQRVGVLGGERAQGVLDPVAQLAEDRAGHVGRVLGHEEDADALGPDQPHGLRHRLEERLAGTREEQVRLVEEEDQPGPLDVADLR